MAKGGKRSKASILKAIATRKANREARLAGKVNTTPEDRIADALVFLRRAHAQLAAKRKPGLAPMPDLYLQLAIRTLEGAV